MFYTPKEVAELLYSNGQNTILGMHLNRLFNESHEIKAIMHNFDEKCEVLKQLDANGHDVWKGGFKMGSVSKAFHQIELKKYEKFK